MTHRPLRSAVEAAAEPPRQRRGLGLVVGAVTTVALTAAACSSGAHPSGNAGGTLRGTAPHEVRAAIVGMERARNFSFSATVVTKGGSTRLTGEFVAPDVEQLRFTAPGGTATDVLFVGSKAYVRSPAGTWTDAIGRPSRATDPRSTFAPLLEASYGVGHHGTFPCTVTAAAASSIVTGARASGQLLCSLAVSGSTVTRVHFAGARFHADVSYESIGSSPPIAHP